MMRNHGLLRDVQGFPNVSGLVRHEDQSCADTWSQLLLSFVTRSPHIGGKALRELLKELAAMALIEEVIWVSIPFGPG